jgi:hypothetical protein
MFEGEFVMSTALTNPLEAAKLALDQKKFDQDTKFRAKEIELKAEELGLKRGEARRSSIFNPLVIAVAGAAIGTLGTAAATYYNGRAAERLEAEKAESERILAVIKTDPTTSANNLRFLVQAGLIVSPKTVATIQALEGAPKPDTKPQAPSVPIDQTYEALRSEITSVRRDARVELAAQGAAAIPLIKDLLSTDPAKTEFRISVGAITALSKMPSEVRCDAFGSDPELRQSVEAYKQNANKTLRDRASEALACPK